MSKFDIVTIGSAIKDIMFYSDDVQVMKNKKNLLKQKLMAVEYGAKIEIDNVYVNYGGGAMNVAVGLNNLGLTVAPMVNLGRDWVGQEMFYFLKQQGIKTSLVKIDKKINTGFSVILTSAKDKEHTIFTYKGATMNLKIPNSLSSIKTSWYYVAPLSMPDWDEQLVKIIMHKKTKDQKVKIAWNPGQKQLQNYLKIKKMMPSIDLLILNQDEAIELALKIFEKKVDKTKVNQARYLLDLLKQLKMSNLIITAAKKGAYAIDSHGNYFYKKTSKVNIVDTVGAGDAFASGFLAGFHTYNDFEKALMIGIKNSQAVLTKIGAQNGLMKYRLQ